jgi:Protein of unknown function (DUF3179)
VFRAEAKGRALRFDTAGVIGGNEVFKDRQTGSRWQQSSLEAISGPLKGQHLELVPFLLTDWGEWRRVHPDTLVLKPLPGYADRMAAKNAEIKEGLSGQGAAPPGVLRKDNRLPPKAMILGLEVDGISKAFPLTALRSVRVVNEQFGAKPVVIVHQPGSDTTTAFSARLNGQTLRFEAADAQASAMVDSETHSRWDPYGRCVSGKLRGSQLESLIVEPEYWFAWSEFHPRTSVFTKP